MHKTNARRRALPKDVDVVESPDGVLNVIIGRRPRGLATLRRVSRRPPKRVG